jgi:hypothetical protein
MTCDHLLGLDSAPISSLGLFDEDAGVLPCLLNCPAMTRGSWGGEDTYDVDQDVLGEPERELAAVVEDAALTPLWGAQGPTMAQSRPVGQ